MYSTLVTWVKKHLLLLLCTNIIVLGILLIFNFQHYMEGYTWGRKGIFIVLTTASGYCIYHLISVLLLQAGNSHRFPGLNYLWSLFMPDISKVLLIGLAMNVFFCWLFHNNNGSLLVSFTVHSFFFLFTFFAVNRAKSFLMQWKQSMQEVERMKQEMLLSQFEVLKNQINPHFFFNSLNTLTTLIPEKPETAVHFVEQLSRVFRYSLQYTNENTVTVSTEMKIVEAYLFLSKQRFNEKLQAQVDVPEAACSFLLMPHAILMLVENAVKHNEISEQHPLHLRIYCDNNEWLVVENTFTPKFSKEKSTGIGQANIIQRYRMMTHIPVMVSTVENKYVVKVPLLSHKNMMRENRE